VTTAPSAQAMGCTSGRRPGNSLIRGEAADASTCADMPVRSRPWIRRDTPVPVRTHGGQAQPKW